MFKAMNFKAHGSILYYLGFHDYTKGWGRRANMRAGCIGILVLGSEGKMIVGRRGEAFPLSQGEVVLGSTLVNKN